MQVRKVGLLDINESIEFLRLKGKVKAFKEKIENAGGEQNLYNIAKSRPFSVAVYISEIDKLLQQIDLDLGSYGGKDLYIQKELSQAKTSLSGLKDNLKKFA
jgi:hypothetical protein